MEEECNLHYLGGGSDKIYNLFLKGTSGSNTFSVSFEYGRRGSTLTTGTKIQTTDEDKARRIFDKLRGEKIGKGYKDITGGAAKKEFTKSSKPFSVTVYGVNTPEFYPQLLKEASPDAVEDLINDPLYCAQEKHDGERRMLYVSDKLITGINKLGKEVKLSDKIIAELVLLEGVDYILDSEIIGDTCYIFDYIDIKILDSKTSIKPEAYYQRYNKVLNLITKNPLYKFQYLKIVPTAWVKEDKQVLFKERQLDNSEGIVFKRIDEFYEQGRKGNQYKFKFTESCTCEVAGHNEKNSVSLHMFDYSKSKAGEVIPVGNVTVYSNQTMPAIGSFVEVRYLYAYKGGSLFQPVLLRSRNDVTSDDCDISQLKYKRDV